MRALYSCAACYNITTCNHIETKSSINTTDDYTLNATLILSTIFLIMYTYFGLTSCIHAIFKARFFLLDTKNLYKISTFHKT